MAEFERDVIVSEDYADLIINHLSNQRRLEDLPGAQVQTINETFSVVYIPVEQFTDQSVNRFGYTAIPHLFCFESEASLQASGVTELRRMPNFDLYGDGVLIGIVDSGINYTDPVFLNSAGATKIVSIWDQNIQSEGGSPFDTEYGTEYTAGQINQALGSANPLGVVPSTDAIGHGTMMAAIAAGTTNEGENFYGVAPNAELVIVKLRPAKQFLKNFFSVPADVVCYQENNLMWGIQYCYLKARQLNRPIVIIIGVGTSQDSHDGRTPLGRYLSVLGDYQNVTVITAAGNEGNLGRHYHGIVDPSIGYNTVELTVGENDTGFSMQIWGETPGIYSIDILTPSGEYITRITAGIRLSRVISFIFERTVIYIDYQIVESETGDQLILLRFFNMAAGTWTFNVYVQGDLTMGFHIWLPMGNFITDQTYFVLPDIYTTLLSPGNTPLPITVTAYNPVSGTLYVNSGRGYNRINTVKPELAAPGVDYNAPNLDHQIVAYTGTSAAAAHAGGIAALMYEWGTVRGNQPGMDTVEIKEYLVRGATRSTNQTYPNRNWGYGALNIYGAFDVLRSD